MDYTVTDTTVTGQNGAIPVRDYVPAEVTAPTAFLWVHGGGFTSGGLDQRESDVPARELAAAGRRVRTIDYRLAPKAKLWGGLDLSPHPHRYPAAHHDLLDVAADLRAATRGPIALGGASAGANIAAGVALALRDTGAPQPAALVLAYGVFHAELPERPDVEADLRGPLAKWAFNPGMTRRMNLNYVGDETLLVPGYAFPGGADLRGLPPTILINSRNDRLRQSGDTFADELRAAGVETRREVIDSTHAYLNAPKTPGFRAGMDLLSDWLTAHDEKAAP
jgi:acetyl esterase/lipase